MKKYYSRYNNLQIILGLFLLLALSITLPSTALAESDSYEETVSAGNRTFNRFCSICHAKDAKGNGPYTSNLNVTPPNLRKLSEANNGIFPWIKMYQIIDGTVITDAHGSKEMPIWGELFDISNWDSSYSEYSKTLTRGRIFELLVYMEYIQE